MTKKLSDDIDKILKRALLEDVGTGDVTTEAIVDPGLRVSAAFVAKAEGVISGTMISARVFELLHRKVACEWLVSDGEAVTPGMTIGRISGNAAAILTGERTALNILQRMSGISSATARLVEVVSQAGTDTVVLDTRKTAPGLRVLDKMAVEAGGGSNHRKGLYDMVLVKDNHIVAAGGIREAMKRVRRTMDEREQHDLKIEIEARTLAEVREVLAHFEATGDPDRIMLDNMARVKPDGSIDTTILREAVEMVDRRIETEASGNVTVGTATAIAETGVDFISAGFLTHSVTALDISLAIEFAG